jgi:hypothetical protein
MRHGRLFAFGLCLLVPSLAAGSVPVGTTSSPACAVDLLFVPAGFAAGDLPRYRCAVSELVSTLRTVSPYDELAFNVWLEEAIGGAIPDCGQSCPTAYWPATFSCTETALSASTEAMDFEVSLLCDSSCGLFGLGTAGIGRVQSLASLSFGIDAIVIVANTASTAGGAYTDSSPPILVVSLANVGTPQSANILAHELGHAFGLEDEYPDTSGGLESDCDGGPNVFEVASLTDASAIPWNDQCSDGPEDPCQTYDDTRCSLVRLAGDEACAGTCAKTCGSGTELWMGACLNCNWARSEPSCRMHRKTEEFCTVCRAHLARMSELFECEPVDFPMMDERIGFLVDRGGLTPVSPRRPPRPPTTRLVAEIQFAGQPAEVDVVSADARVGGRRDVVTLRLRGGVLQVGGALPAEKAELGTITALDAGRTKVRADRLRIE